VTAVLVVDAGIRAPLYIVATVPRATKLLPLNFSVSTNKPPTQLLPSKERAMEEDGLEHAA
jgi:hypothetical protein